MFEELWGTNELLSSFDSINVLPPSAATGAPPDTASWLHTDQAPLRRGFFCIQGILNMVDVGPDTTGLEVFLGSTASACPVSLLASRGDVQPHHPCKIFLGQLVKQC